MPTVLIIDDNSAMRRLLRELLETEGLAVIEAEDGEEGLAKVIKDRVDLVITDILMPGKIEGIETIATIREWFASLPVVAMSAGGCQGQGGYLDTAVEFGASATIAKPIDADELLGTVQALLADPPANAVSDSQSDAIS